MSKLSNTNVISSADPLRTGLYAYIIYQSTAENAGFVGPWHSLDCETALK